MVLSLLSACAEKNQYKEAVLAQLQGDQDLKDYKIKPERMADCVVETSSRNMPGIAELDPERKKAYIAYAKMINLTKSKSPQQVMEELRAEFGSAQELSYAHGNYTESILSCQTALISEGEEDLKAEADESLPAESTTAIPENVAPLTPSQPSASSEGATPPAPVPAQ